MNLYTECTTVLVSGRLSYPHMMLKASFAFSPAFPLPFSVMKYLWSTPPLPVLHGLAVVGFLFGPFSGRLLQVQSSKPVYLPVFRGRLIHTTEVNPPKESPSLFFQSLPPSALRPKKFNPVILCSNPIPLSEDFLILRVAPLYLLRF